MELKDTSVHVGALRSETVERLRAWRAEGDTLVKTARALGIEGEVIAQFDGMLGGRGATTTRTRTAARSRPARRSERMTPDQALAHLREHPGISAKSLAAAAGLSYDAMQRQLRAWQRSGQVRREGERNETRWFVAEAVGAGAPA